MPSLLVTPATLAQFSRADVSQLPEAYLQNICRVGHGLVRRYLGFDPAVQVHTHEQGAVQLIMTGRERAMAALRLGHQPLSAPTPLDVLSELQLLYPAPMPPLDILGQATILGGITLWRNSGQIRIPFMGYGIANALFYQYGAAAYAPAGPTGYQATYKAGFAITAQDQSDFPDALAVPVELQQAAAWLIEGLLAQGQRVGDDLSSGLAGELMAFTNLDYSEKYQRDQRGDTDTVGKGLSLLFGTQQGRWAQENLDLLKRTSIERVVFA